MNDDLDSKDDFLDIRDDNYFNTDMDGRNPVTDPEDMEEFGLVNLSKLMSLREQFNWENEEERYPFYLRLSKLTRSWRGNLPNLRDFFRDEEIDYLLMEAVKNRKKERENNRGSFFIRFVYRTGYRDRPELSEDGKPLLRRTTAVHCVEDTKHLENILYYLFKIYHRFDVNYIDESGYTHFHAACKYVRDDVVEEFLQLGQDPNCLWTETGDSPLHLALSTVSYNRGAKKTIQLLLRSGADSNLANKEGSTPLHIICKRLQYLDNNLAKLFFEINDEKHQTVQIDAKDGLGRTPLQLAVASLLPDVVDVLLDRGADLSSFVFPTENYFAERWKPIDIINDQGEDLEKADCTAALLTKN
ncbi:hypothetical protein TKK_0004705 [Trichogramma kaykai]